MTFKFILHHFLCKFFSYLFLSFNHFLNHKKKTNLYDIRKLFCSNILQFVEGKELCSSLQLTRYSVFDKGYIREILQIATGSSLTNRCRCHRIGVRCLNWKMAAVHIYYLITTRAQACPFNSQNK